ncbi:alpha-amylase family glycosyl hydrolase [Phenylobacterium sp.]|uniref:alpha-amylase family glycosyl hydrolase n=1 Tax=Phenylobacterium sp. TaxID=1871053 RepID=UPI002734233A|nr:alpha-amylase family glycosyl hydrolase [Phenylobacterium sp.]MDP3659796.1 alpha-amylase family glycosyl hydrolase [Phenylobacterium sp.]
MSPWWKGAAVYQIYVRSFYDADGDGQGDLAGVLAKLDYVQGLGVDAIWLSPIHPSPDRDWGYDVADFDSVHPDYGTLADFQALLAECHARGLKLILDEVLSHTSDEHPWFAASRDQGPDGEKAEWYVWADPHPDGTAPNNWLSVFGGPAWSYQPARRQHYHHKFLRQQPKLNWRAPGAREAALAVLDTWLARGVDGFRLDVAGTYLHDADLTDNPAVPVDQRTPAQWGHASDLQRHVNDANLPENVEMLDLIRRRVEAFGDRFVFGEFFEEPERSGAYLPPDQGLHSGYAFELLHAEVLTPALMRDHAARMEAHPGHWPSIAFSNHDIVRTATRFGSVSPRISFALLCALRGNPLIYQGEELGLPQAALTRRQLRDPVGDLYWPTVRGRDGCRTPMPWRADAPNLGFSDGAPWLPAAPEHAGLTVAAQEDDADSMLAFSRRAIAARRSSSALRLGEMSLLRADGGVVAFLRETDEEQVLCAFNLGAEAESVDDSRLIGASVLLTYGAAALDGAELRLDAQAFAWVTLPRANT